MADGHEPEKVGWGKPPKASQFPLGHRRSAKKRRKRQPTPLPYEAVFSQLVDKPEADGTVSKITLEQAVMEHLEKLALLGYSAAHEQVLRAEAEIRRRLPGVGEDNNTYVQIIGGLESSSVHQVALPLNIVVKINPDSADPLILIRHWAVERALSRLDRELNVEEQRVVWEATVNPKKAYWPDWWTERRGTGKPKKKRPLIEAGYYPPCIKPYHDDDPDEG